MIEQQRGAAIIFAGAIMPSQHFHADNGVSVAPWLPAREDRRSLQKLRGVIQRLVPRTVASVAFLAATGWAFFCSLFLGVGTASAGPAEAWLWLGGEVGIGVMVFAALILSAPPHHDSGP